MMQVITPIQNDERFFASGTYTHHQRGEATGFLQHWMMHRQPDGSDRVRVHMDGRGADGRDILIEFVRRTDGDNGTIVRCDVHATGNQDDTLKTVRATYLFSPQSVQVLREIDGVTRSPESLALPLDYVVRLASMNLTGYAVAEMAQRNGKDVPVVAYRPNFKDESAFSLHVYNQSALFLRNEQITVDGRLHHSRLYKRWVSDEPETVFNVWLDDHDIPLKHADGDGYRRFMLTDYKRGN